MPGSGEVYCVIGGSGFLGRRIVEALLARGDRVSVLDIVDRYNNSDVHFYAGDIRNETFLQDALRKSGATCIIHTASPPHGLKDTALYRKVNVDGTKAVIAAAIAVGVTKLVYTSSVAVSVNSRAFIDADLRRAFHAYNKLKEQAEDIVMAANGRKGLCTVALQPAEITGPGASQALDSQVEGIAKLFQEGKVHYKIGNVNCATVSDVAHDHLCAADTLVPLSKEQDYETDPALPLSMAESSG
ncbi:NAD(P)-binding protein [Auriscalpium vulgare]|uniref:NAD(P)-binding protein n=1 Tax=Auriscalpium vulgare TaxID=40419 RepID=A0ACB8R471_9AGAM|nr:NAD(P)-binding protein [Auriscalpium vulgare]